jgi:hypothetical protein
MLDVHNIPLLAMFMVNAILLSEYGGISCHKRPPQTGRNWGYAEFRSSDEATTAYINLAEKLKLLIPTCYSAAVYTQTTDVETEVNGLMTYDRKMVKLDEERIRKINSEVCNSLSNQ